MSGLGASVDCLAPITADSRVSIGEPLINGSPASVIYSVARCGTTNYSLNDTVLDLVPVVRDAAYAQVTTQKRAVAERFGDLLAAFTGEHVGEPRLLICLYGPELLHGDLKFVFPPI